MKSLACFKQIVILTHFICYHCSDTYAYYVLSVSREDTSEIKKKSIFDEFKDDPELKNLRGNMDNDLDIDFRFDGPAASFEIIGNEGTGYIFQVLIMKALVRSKRDPVGNELEEDVVECIADEIADDMYRNVFSDLVGEMTSIIEEQDKDAFNWD